MSIIKEIRASDEYKKYKKIVLKVQDRLKVEKDRNEALSMYAGRTSRKLFGKQQYALKALIDASLNDLAVRSRLVELRVQCSIQIDLLHSATKAMKQQITTEFHEELKAYKTVGQRTAVIERCVKGALDIESEGSALIKLLDDMIGDIDKSSFQLRNMLEALKLLSEKPGQVV